MHKISVRTALASLLAGALAACATVPVSGTSAEHPFQDAVNAINATLALPGFEDGSVSRLEPAGPCKALFRSTWTKATSNAKGYTAVETTTLIDFATDVEHAEHVAPYDDPQEGHIERWSESIRLHFRAPLPSRFTSSVPGMSEMQAEEYAPPFVSIGVAGTATPAQVDDLVAQLDALARHCTQTS